MATKVKVDFRSAEKNLRKRFNQFKKTELKKSANILRKQIVEDTRDGKGWDGEDFPSLKEKTIDRRRALIGAGNKKHSAASPSKSNATLTGDTIQKIKAFATRGKITIVGKGNHRYMTGVRGKRLKGSNAPIRDILSGLEDKGWKILGVSDEAKKRIVKQFKQFLRRRKK